MYFRDIQVSYGGRSAGKVFLHNKLNTMTTSTTEIKKTRAPKTPRNFDSILKGALSLPLNERVGMVNKLKDSIHAEVETVKAAAEQADKIANGL